MNRLQPSTTYGEGYCVICGWFFQDIAKAFRIGIKFLPHAPCCIGHIHSSEPAYIKDIGDFFAQSTYSGDESDHVEWLRFIACRFMWISEKPEYKWIYEGIDISFMNNNDSNIRMPSWNESMASSKSKTDDNLRSIFQ